MRELKIERIREMTEDDINTKIKELKEELFHLRFRNTMRQLQNPLLLREKRRDVARLETILNEHRTGIRPLVLGPGTAPAASAPSRGAVSEAAAPGRMKSAKTKAKAAAKGKAAAKVAKSASGRSKPAAKSRSKPATSKKKGKKA
jgi:large subunit ribosomal protein L29